MRQSCGAEEPELRTVSIGAVSVGSFLRRPVPHRLIWRTRWMFSPRQRESWRDSDR